MKPTNRSQSSVFSTASSQQVSEAQSAGAQTSKPQSEIPTLLNAESSSQDTFIVSPQPQPSTESLQPNHISQAVMIVVATVMGLTIFSGVLYLMLANLNLQRSQPSSSESRQPQGNQNKQTTPTVESIIQVQKSNEAQATMLLDRARRLAIANRFEDAIAEANKIPFDSLLYQETRQAIAQWSEQAQQQEAEQRAIQQSNQQHLQTAQQALDQNDWKTALQVVKQINIHATNQNAFWQQQKDAMVQTIEPYQHEYKAREFLDQGELENAVYEAKQLPSVAPWQEKKALIVEQVTQKFADKEVAKKWNERCQTLTQGNMSRCPYLSELKDLADLLPSARWLPGLNSPGRKSRH